MARNIVVDSYACSHTSQRVEVVERKGLGHPDYICDSIANQISVDLCAEYIKRFGTILHHNIDKSLLVAGRADVAFGGGRVTEPMLLVFGDRATFEAEGQQIAVPDIAVNAAKKWIGNSLRFVDPEKGMCYQVELKPGSAELTDIFRRKKGEILGANDTSAAVGYAPLSATEKVVLETERFLNSPAFKKRYPESGEDIKVMGMRQDGKLLLTVAHAFVDRYVKDEKDYFRKKEEITDSIRDFTSKFKNGFSKIDIDVNTLDEKGRGINGVYLTVTGTSADSADCGQVGRGNRVNGIIPLNRPTSSEAAAGKNPVSHVGKIYNVLTHRMADRIHGNVDGLDEVYVWLLSQIGKPIDSPAVAAAQVLLKEGVKITDVRKAIKEEIDAELADIQKFCMELAKGKIPIC